MRDLTEKLWDLGDCIHCAYVRDQLLDFVNKVMNVQVP